MWAERPNAHLCVEVFGGGGCRGEERFQAATQQQPLESAPRPPSTSRVPLCKWMHTSYKLYMYCREVALASPRNSNFETCQLMLKTQADMLIWGPGDAFDLQLQLTRRGNSSFRPVLGRRSPTLHLLDILQKPSPKPALNPKRSRKSRGAAEPIQRMVCTGYDQSDAHLCARPAETRSVYNACCPPPLSERLRPPPGLPGPATAPTSQLFPRSLFVSGTLTRSGCVQIKKIHSQAHVVVKQRFE